MSDPGNATILWIKYLFGLDIIEVNTAEKDVIKIIWSGPGMFEVHRQHGVVDSVVSDQVVLRAKVDQPKKVVSLDQDVIELVS